MRKWIRLSSGYLKVAMINFMLNQFHELLLKPVWELSLARLANVMVLLEGMKMLEDAVLVPLIGAKPPKVAAPKMLLAGVAGVAGLSSTRG
jgi:hypothetical protein